MGEAIIAAVHVGRSWKNALADEHKVMELVVAAMLCGMVVGVILMLLVTRWRIKHASLDITRRKQAEGAMRDSHEFLDKIINGIRDPIFVEDAKHNFILVNDAFCTFDGRPREEILDKTIWEASLRPEEAAGIWDMDEQVLTTARDSMTEEKITKLTIPPGLPRFVQTSKSLYVDPSGRRFVVGILHDVTKLRRMEKEILKSHELLRQRVASEQPNWSSQSSPCQAQTDLVQREKMSLLGQLSAGVARNEHPIGSIMNVMADGLDHLREFVAMGRPIFGMSDDARQWILQACMRMLAGPADPSGSLRRTLSSQIEREIADAGFKNPRRAAAIIAACFGTNWRGNQNWRSTCPRNRS